MVWPNARTGPNRVTARRESVRRNVLWGAEARVFELTPDGRFMPGFAQIGWPPQMPGCPEQKKREARYLNGPPRLWHSRLSKRTPLLIGKGVNRQKSRDTEMKLSKERSVPRAAKCQTAQKF